MSAPLLMTSQDISILVVTGETSGERHAAGLITELKKWNPQWNIDGFGSGGTRMREAGVELLIDVSKLSAIGTWEALSQMANYWKLYRQILAEVGKRRPQLAILVDFPDFNLRLASRLKAMNVPICYFIGPQVWAWRSSRVKKIRRYVDLMLVVFPFEEEYAEVWASLITAPSTSFVWRFAATSWWWGTRRTCTAVD